MTIIDDVIQMLTAGGAAACKFVAVGDTHKGKIIAAEKRQQTDYATGTPKTWDNGEPMWEIVITLDTGIEDENGETHRRLFVRGAMLKAVREALKDANAKLEVGGELAVRYTGDGEPSKKGFNAPKLFKAKYTPPAPAAVDLDEL